MKLGPNTLGWVIAIVTLGVIAGLFVSKKGLFNDLAEKPSDTVTEMETDSRDFFLPNGSAAAALPELIYPEGTFSGELQIQFSTLRDYRAYIEALKAENLAPLGQIDEILALRISEEVLLKLNPDKYGGRRNFSHRVEQPKPPERVAPTQIADLKPYGVSARNIVQGLPQGDGSGIMVGILDSGMVAHPQFDDAYVVHINLVGGRVAGAGAAHGTSVASIISGKEGIVPQAELFGLRVLDDEGQGNSFHVAEGIIQAVDLGVKIINMSLGLYEDSPIVQRAVRYASDRGVLMVAAAGNDGYGQLPYPAAYDEVLSVTALDAAGRQAGFPNQSDQIDFAAPGVGVETAWMNEGVTLFSGTSAAAPFVTGTLASLMSGESAMEPARAVELLQRYLNDSGAPGRDPVYGAGAIDWQRLRERETAGILDIALAGIYLDPKAQPGTRMPISVTVQNRGTRWTNRAELDVMVNGGEPVNFTIGTLGPGQTSTRKVFALIPSINTEDSLKIAARVQPEDLKEDLRLDNNFEAVQFRPR